MSLSNRNALLVYHLLYSIRENWGEDSALEERYQLALKLTELAIKDYEMYATWFKGEEAQKYADYAEMMKTLYKEIERYTPYEDGRYFRDDFPYGYIDMLKKLGMENWE